MKIVILGAGTFGTALANAINPNMDVTLYTIENDVTIDINTNSKNTKYFPNKHLGNNISATSDFSDIADAELVYVAIPSHTVVDFFSKNHFDEKAIIVNGAKGFARENLLITDLLESLIPNNPICSIKGPSFASELIFEIPTAFTIAAKEKKIYETICSTFRKDLIVTDYSDNIKAVEFLSIVKNAYAIVMGIVDAYYNSSNVRFLVFTKIINEIRRLMELADIDQETLFNYCGIGDLGLTSLNDLSRNRTLGLLIGKGFFDTNLTNNVVLEGVRALNNIWDTIPKDKQHCFPIVRQTKLLLEKKTKVKTFINRIIFE